MEAMLLAAGIGSRLNTLTASTPKCLIEVAERPILEWNIRKLKLAGVKRLVINLHYLKDQVRDFIERNEAFGVDIRFSEEEELLNTGGGLKAAEGYFSGKSAILVMNADILSSLNLKSFYEYHHLSKNAATLATRPPKEPRVLLFDSKTNSLKGWRNKTTGEELVLPDSSNLAERGFSGIQVISPVMFGFFGRPKEKLSSIQGYLSAVEAGEPVQEFLMAGEEWFDIGTPEQLKECREFYANNKILNDGDFEASK